MLQENEQKYNSKLTDISTEVAQLTNRIKFLTQLLADKITDTKSEYDEINANYDYKKEQAGLLLNLFNYSLPQLNFLGEELTSARIELQKLSKQLENKAYHGGDR
ncbi:hypothetical protein [Ligilactobacillus murinus]|uniref:hypothetical protein n=1 Tax=Ligilactobacillus murinus TaxID=1622 RepID=UPI003518FB13